MFQFSDDLPAKATWMRRGLWSRFTPDVEVVFRRLDDAELLRYGRWAALAAILVMLVYGVLDVFMLELALLPSFLWVRFLFVVIPLTFVKKS
ncbi:hypothetical protein H0484_06340 [Pusillimonas sp. CC-YST705]|uniref:Uncharacterized protein n=1 Tax=Mesopusillimonas faecipullorum TaxID=2755040 RepID=A0ABS8CBF6_9BURK|nr:hypothetical protein [Mesopusillimonas faecipullorum]MCB5363371.1 hypothetical protein [Mesopusillimonas faecipullorum]